MYKMSLLIDMGLLQARDSVEDATNVNLNAVDMERYKRRFNLFDIDRKGFITRQDLMNVFDSVKTSLLSLIICSTWRI